MAQILPASLGPRSLDLTRVGAGAMENVWRWYGDFPSCSVPGHLKPTMHTACAAAAAAEHRAQTSGPCRAPWYERDHVPCRRRRPAQRQRGRGPPSLRCSSPSRLRARRSRAHRSRRRRASPCRGTPGRSHQARHSETGRARPAASRAARLWALITANSACLAHRRIELWIISLPYSGRKVDRGHLRRS
jgi:hypothetical protein